MVTPTKTTPMLFTRGYWYVILCFMSPIIAAAYLENTPIFEAVFIIGVPLAWFFLCGFIFDEYEY